MPRTGATNRKKLPENEQIFRYWVEVLDLKNLAVRNLPLGAVAKLLIPRRKNEEQRPREDILELKDGSAIVEAENLEDLAAQLRERYPDGTYERTLHRERDCQAEERRKDAMSRLVQMIVESFVEGLSKDDAATFSVWFKTSEGKKALRESWPKIVDAYFHALCNPKR